MTGFSTTQARVMYGLCRYPGLRDVALARKLALPRSTLGAAKAQLLAARALQPSFFPDFGALGCELMACSYLERVQEGGVAPLLEAAVAGGGLPQIVHLIAEGSRGLVLSYHRNYTEYDAVSEELYQGLQAKGHLPTHHDLLFPLFNIIQLARFDFAGVINRLFELGFDDPYPPVEASCPLERATLRPSQRKVMLALSRQPAATDRELAESTRLSLPTVARARQELVSRGLLRLRWLPRSLKELGLNILAMLHVRLDTSINVITRIQTLQRILLTLTPHLFLSRSWEIFLLAPFRDFSDYQHHLNQLMAELWGEGLLLAPPTTQLMEVERVKPIRHFAFAPLLDELLGE